MPQGSRDGSLAASSFDEVFCALDGRRVDRDGSEWVARVQGVHSDGHQFWIQLARADDCAASILIRCSRFVRAEHLTTLLERCMPTSAVPGQRLSLMNVLPLGNG